MGIWIRSQDRLRLLDLNGYNLSFENDSFYQIIGFDTRNSNNNFYWILGRYSTKEKAIKVLDMLQEKIIEIDKNKFLGMTEVAYKNIVIEMPEDDEVK